MAGAPPFASAAPVGGAGENPTTMAEVIALHADIYRTVATAPGLRVQTFAYLTAGAGKKQWTGCESKATPGDRGKKYGFHMPVSQMMTSMLEDNSVALTPQLRAFVENRSGDVRISDCADFPGQQGKYVLYDVLQGTGIVKGYNNLPPFIEKYIIDAKHATGGPLYPSLAEVPSGHSSVSFQNLHGNTMFIATSKFCLFLVLKSNSEKKSWILVPETAPEI